MNLIVDEFATGVQNMKNSNRSFVIIVIFVGIILYGIGLGWGLPSEFSPAVDVDFPIGPLAFVGQYSDPASTSTYPAFHYLLTLPFYAIVILISKLSGGFVNVSSVWPYGFNDPVLWFSILLLVSRVLSMGMGIGLLFAIWPLRPNREDMYGQFLGIFLLALSGPFAYYAREANLDIPYNFWWAIAFYFAWRTFFVSETYLSLIWSGLFSALAMGTKDQVAGLVVGLGLSFFLIDSHFGAAGWRQRIKNAIFFGATVVVVYALVAIAPQPFRWLHHLTVWTLNSPRVADFVEFEPTLNGQIELLFKTIRHLSILVSPIGILLIILGFIRLIKDKRWEWIILVILPILTYYLIVIVNIRYVYERFVLPISIVLIPIIGVGASWLGKSLNRYSRWLSIVLVMFTLSYQFLTGFLPITYLQAVDIRRELSANLVNYVPSGSAILWNNGRIADLPNADVYTAYRLVLPKGENAPLRSVEHILLPYNPSAHCLLSTYLLDETEQNMKLIVSWENPSWVTARVMDHVPTGYYLYDMDGKCSP
jgi:hypothetical protein